MSATMKRKNLTWNGCEHCHGAVWTDENGVTACRGTYQWERVIAGETDGPPDEPPCGWEIRGDDQG